MIEGILQQRIRENGWKIIEIYYQFNLLIKTNVKMIDSQQIEELLKDTKLSSMTDVIQFVLEHVLKLVNFQPIHDLSSRIAQLQKPQGLDSIMIEQVKALIQAILQQRQDKIKRDVEKAVQNNVSIALQHQNSRRSLREIDLIEFVNSQNSEKYNKQIEQKINNSSIQQTHFDTLKKQITQLRIVLQRKSDRREINDMKIQFQKQLSNKMTLNQTEKIVEKFQKDVFIKLSQTSTSLQKIQYQMKKFLMNEVSMMKKELIDSNKMVQVKQKMSKFEKKVKKIDSQVNSSIKNYSSLLQITKKQSKDSIQQICSFIQNLDSKIKNNQNELKIVVKNLQKENKNQLSSGAWIAENKSSLKNLCISWQRQFTNQDSELYRFESGKSQIVITEPGFYTIECYIVGCERAPELFINSQSYLKLQRSLSNRCLCYTTKQTFRVNESINKISIKLDSQSNYNSAALKLTRIG